MVSDVCVVGGGLVGLAVAWQLKRAQPGLRLTLLEKEGGVACHQSSHNSGVLHAGLYYAPGSSKAQLAVSGLREMVRFCREHGIAHDQCGKIVVATHEDEHLRLENLFRRGTANGLHGLRMLSSSEIAEFEPHAVGTAAIHVPEEGIVDYPAVAARLAVLIEESGGNIHLNAGVDRLVRTGGRWVVESRAGAFEAHFVVTCAGLHSDRLVRAAGQRATAQIVPFRGEYFQLRNTRQHLVRNLIYPVPDPKFPFLGVHFTRLIGGGIEAGPNAVLAFAREGYRWRDCNPRDLAEVALFPGLWRFLAKYPSMWSYEVWRSFSKKEFARSLQRMVPEIQESDLEPGGAGVRAQAMTNEGKLVEDFHFEQDHGILHVVNAPSPAATASLAIGEAIAARVIPQLS